MTHSNNIFTIQVVVKKPKDPLLFQGEKRNEEDKVTIHCQTGLKLTDAELEKIRLPPLPLVPLGRHGTDCNDLIAMGLNVIDSESRPKRQYVFYIQYVFLHVTQLVNQELCQIVS